MPQVLAPNESLHVFPLPPLPVLPALLLSSFPVISLLFSFIFFSFLFGLSLPSVLFFHSCSILPLSSGTRTLSTHAHDLSFLLPLPPPLSPSLSHICSFLLPTKECERKDSMKNIHQDLCSGERSIQLLNHRRRVNGICRNIPERNPRKCHFQTLLEDTSRGIARTRSEPPFPVSLRIVSRFTLSRSFPLPPALKPFLPVQVYSVADGRLLLSISHSVNGRGVISRDGSLLFHCSRQMENQQGKAGFGVKFQDLQSLKGYSNRVQVYHPAVTASAIVSHLCSWCCRLDFLFRFLRSKEYV